MIWLFVAFVVLPVVEIWLLTQVAGQIGWPLALFLVIAVSVAGAWLVRREGLGVIRRVQTSMSSGRIPTDDLADGAMIFFASALMLTPGFLTDAIGLALLIPPIRAIIRPPLVGFFRRRIDLRVSGLGGAGLGGAASGGFGGFGGFGTTRPSRGDVIDVDGHQGDTDPGSPFEDDPPEIR
ncbi:MAG: FxsA family protein [Acidimicrobiales bacterium]